jgi:antitoxin component YwqK of YwqJK toxin-antitoxin module
MKNHLIISLLFLSVGFSQQEYDGNDIIEMDNGLWSVKFSDEPITGKVYGNFGKEGEELTKVYIGKLINGKKDGKWTIWYHNTGTKSYEGTFKDGEQDGLFTEWYKDGQKERERTYQFGKLIEKRTRRWLRTGHEY